MTRRHAITFLGVCLGAALAAPTPAVARPAVTGDTGGPAAATVVAAGDIACSPSSSRFNQGRGVGTDCRQRDTARAAAALSPDAVLALGDNQYEYGALADFRQSFLPSWGQFLDRSGTGNRLWPVPGNHELAYKPTTGYWAAFNGGTEASPNRTGAAGVPGKGWYAQTVGRWRILALNSECGFDGAYLGTDGCRRGSAQYSWLKGQLKEAPKCTLAMYHRPLFTIGEHEGFTGVRPLWRLLARKGADVVLNGHNHDYERFPPLNGSGRRDSTGIREFVVGAGGKQLYAWGGRADPVQPVARDNTTVGVLSLELGSRSYSWDYVPAGFAANGSYTDSGSGRCH